MSLRIENFLIGPMGNNLYLLVDEAAREAVVIDPSMESEEALQRARQLQAEGVTLNAIWNTHGHFDHIYDNAVWKSAFPVPLSMHSGDEMFIERLREQALWFGMEPPEEVQPDLPFEEGQTLHVGDYQVQVMHTPGHSPGSVSFYLESEGVCISGDVLFRGSIGRTDLPGCSEPQLKQSLARLAALPASTKILPGHGDATTVGAELATNPFLQDLSI